MAVHLNARLNTRFIPILFSVALALIVASAAVHAHASGDLSELPAQDQIQAQSQEPLEPHSTSAEELREIMENAKPERVDRSPGFSPITLAPAKEEPVAEVTDRQQPDSVEDQR